MKLSKTKRDHSLGFIMTPMIDIVFLLIIFFLTVSQFTRVVDHPLSLAQVALGTVESTPTTVTINLDHDGKIYFSGEQYTLQQTFQSLQELLASNGNEPSQVMIEMRCDRLCPTDSVNQLVQRLTDLGFRQVYVSVAGDQ